MLQNFINYKAENKKSVVLYTQNSKEENIREKDILPNNDIFVFEIMSFKIYRYIDTLIYIAHP